MQYPNFRDIERPLALYKRSLFEEKATYLSAFSDRDVLTFTASIAAPFSPSNVCLRFHADESGEVKEIPMPLAEGEENGRIAFSATVPVSHLTNGKDNGLFYYRVIADTVYGRLYSHATDGYEYAWFSDKEGYADPYQLLIFSAEYKTPDFLRRGVMYQIFVDRFFRGGDAPPREDVEMAENWGAEISQYPAYPGAPLKNNLFYGGDLDGVRKKLPYLASIGVTVLYLCPIFEAYSNHKYDTADYMCVDPMFGGREALDRLLVAAKDIGIRIILDGVFNHTGAISRYFNMDGRYDSLGAYQSKESPYYSWYRFRNFPDDYESWWGIRILPSVDSANADYRTFIAGEGGVVDTYMHAGVSGFRLDVADELAPVLIRDIRARIKARGEDTAIIGEVWEDASNKIAYDRRRHYFRGHELDSVMNYPLKNAIITYLLSENAEQFAHTMTVLYAHYPRHVSEVMMNLLGTHDTERILTVLGGRDLSGLSYEEIRDVRLSENERALAVARLRVAYAILYFMPGIPCIYYGDEVGMEGGRDPFNRRTYPWGQEEGDFLEHFRHLAAIRKTEEAVLAHGFFRVEHARGGELVFSRSTEKTTLLLLANSSPEKSFVYSDLVGEWWDAEHSVSVTGEITLSPLSYRLLRKG